MSASPADLDRVFAVVHQVFGADRAALSGDTTADDIDGWDSVSHASLVLELETEFNKTLNFEATIALANLRELADYIAESSGGAQEGIEAEVVEHSAANAIVHAPLDDSDRVLIVFGNCQAEAIAGCLRNHPAIAGHEVHVLLSFQMPGEEPPSLPPELYRRCGILWEQATPLVRFPHRDKLPASCRIRTFPSIDFNLLWPLNAPEPRNHTLEGFPFGPFSYGDRIINEIVALGLSGEAGWAAYAERSQAAMPNLRRLADIEHNRWASLERDLDVKLAAQVFRRFKTERLFYTYNHPTPNMLCHVATELLRVTGLSDEQNYEILFQEVRALFTWEFGQNYEVPVHPSVAAAFDLSWWSPTMLYNWHNQPKSAKDFIQAQIDWIVTEPSPSMAGESFNDDSVVTAADDHVDAVAVDEDSIVTAAGDHVDTPAVDDKQEGGTTHDNEAAAASETADAVRGGKLIIVDQNALAVGGHYHAYTQCVAWAALDLGLDAYVLHNRKFSGRWFPEEITAIAAFDYSWSEAEARWQTGWHAGNIAYDFAEATRGIDLGPDDHVFFSTVGYAELFNVLRYVAESIGTAPTCHYHILLRYDPDILRARIIDFVEPFARLKRSPTLRAYVHFHTDTEGLTSAFTDLLGIPFTTLPIPFLQQSLKAAMSAAGPKQADAPLVIAYLGDARLEKNYNLIPDAVAHLYDDYVRTGKVRFVIQSNFNVPEGEPGILSSAQRLGQYLPEQVTLLANALATDEYYQTLADADAVIIPYDAERYRLRSSGILVEAMAAGKPVVTMANSWMATQVGAENAVLLDPGKPLGPAIEHLVTNYARYRDAAVAKSTIAMQRSSGEIFVRQMLASARSAEPAATADRPHILYVLDGDVLVLRNGAGVTAMTQLNYLHDAGYKVSALFLLNKHLSDPAEVEAWTRELRDRVACFQFDAFFIAAPSRLSPATLTQKARRERYDFSIINDIEAAAHRDVSIDLVKHVSSSKFDAIWLNYVVNYPLLERLGLTDVPVIGETHDIQSFQKAIYGKRRIDDDDLQLELDLLSRCAHLISVSATETAYISKRLPDKKIATTGIFPAVHKSPLRSLAGPKSIGEIISSCGPDDIEYQWERAWASHRIEKIRRLESVETLDIVFVSSNHLANVSGLKWFLDAIYFPYLASSGVSVVVAGSICDLPDWPRHERLFFVGRLRELSPLYAAAKLVVLPILEGAGIAVKTQEALNHGRPVVATSVARRGLPAGLDGVVEVNEPNGFAEAVLDLLKSDDKRRELGRSARRAARMMASPKRYADILNPVFAEILGARARVVSREEEREVGPIASLEWCPLVRHANRAVRNWLDNQLVEHHSLEEFGKHPRAEVREILADILDELVAKRSAFACQTEADVLSKVVTRRRSDCRQALDFFLLQLDAFQGTAPASLHQTNELQLAASTKIPLQLLAFASIAEPLALPDLRAIGSSEPQDFSLDNVIGYQVSLAADTLAPSDLTLLRIESAAPFSEHVGLVASQSFDPLRPSAHFSMAVHPDGGRPTGAIILSPDKSFSINLPPHLSNVGACVFVDLIVRPEPIQLHVRAGPQSLAEESTVRYSDVFAHRYRLPNGMAGLEVSVASGRSVLVEIRRHVVFGSSIKDALLVCDAYFGRSDTPADEAAAKAELFPERANGGHDGGNRRSSPNRDGKVKSLTGLAKSFSKLRDRLSDLN